MIWCQGGEPFLFRLLMLHLVARPTEMAQTEQFGWVHSCWGPQIPSVRTCNMNSKERYVGHGRDPCEVDRTTSATGLESLPATLLTVDVRGNKRGTLACACDLRFLQKYLVRTWGTVALLGGTISAASHSCRCPDRKSYVAKAPKFKSCRNLQF